MTTWTIPSLEEQQAAYDRYVALRKQADAEYSFELARAAADAWIAFLNLYMPDREKMPERRTTGGNVSAFPVHKTRASQNLTGDAS